MCVMVDVEEVELEVEVSGCAPSWRCLATISASARTKTGESLRDSAR